VQVLSVLIQISNGFHIRIENDTCATKKPIIEKLSSSSSSLTTYSINIIDYSTDLFEEYFFASKLVVFEISRKNSITFLLTKYLNNINNGKNFKKNVAFSLSHTQKIIFLSLRPPGILPPDG
jgi:hypothetical protein